MLAIFLGSFRLKDRIFDGVGVKYGAYFVSASKLLLMTSLNHQLIRLPRTKTLTSGMSLDCLLRILVLG